MYGTLRGVDLVPTMSTSTEIVVLPSDEILIRVVPDKCSRIKKKDCVSLRAV
jgi:hypothetical protein